MTDSDAEDDSTKHEARHTSNDSDEPEIRTDGGEVATQNPGFGTTGIQGDPTEPPQPDVPPFSDKSDQGETPSNQLEDTHSKGGEIGNLPDSVETHFTPAELQRLQRIAASTNAKSAWVIKRLFRDSEE